MEIKYNIILQRSSEISPFILNSLYNFLLDYFDLLLFLLMLLVNSFITFIIFFHHHLSPTHPLPPPAIPSPTMLKFFTVYENNKLDKVQFSFFYLLPFFLFPGIVNKNNPPEFFISLKK